MRRKSKEDVGYRDIYVALDGEQIAILHAGDEVSREVEPGPHRLRAHNTLFRKTVDVTLGPGEHATFNVVNRAGFGTYSVLAFFLGRRTVVSDPRARGGEWLRRWTPSWPCS